MFKSKVVLIIGAGASHELGFPLGSELKVNIGRSLNIKFQNFGDQISGDELIVEALRDKVRLEGSGDINRYRRAGVVIAETMPLALSIDNFLYAHGHDPEIVFMGKLGIARCILAAERSSPIWQDGFKSDAPFLGVEGTWYAKFFRLLSANTPLGEVEDIFRNLSIISFNYDRSLEHYLFRSLMNYYRISGARASSIMNSLDVFHPYGTVGYLPWQDTSNSIPYGGTEAPGELLKVAAELKTFTESISDERRMSDVRRALSESQAVLFLGFAFHQVNMRLMELHAAETSRRFYGSAFGISPQDCEVIASEVAHNLKSRSVVQEIAQGVKCAELFDRYWRTFSSL